MLDNNLLKLIVSTAAILDLEDALIEKDYFVTQVIHALSEIENDSFLLVFAGGTCLAKGHKIIKRMSEDVDFKIHLKNITKSYSKSKLLKELKEFRTHLKSQLMVLGLDVGEPVVRNEGKYSQIEINYPSGFSLNSQLRPHVLLEFTVSNIRLRSENLHVRTLIEETLENTNIFPQRETQCISICETAIEKWVGLTRRVMAIERGYHSDDKTLIRHVYDLNAIQALGKINTDFFLLAPEIVNYDMNQFKNQYIEYSENPSAEIRQSISILKNKPLWKQRYNEFIETMVYAQTDALKYENAIEFLEDISTRILDSLSVEMA